MTVQGQSEPCFTATCGFKKPEKSRLDVQDHLDLWETFRPALEGKKPGDFEEVPGMDVPWVSLLPSQPSRSTPPRNPVD